MDISPLAATLFLLPFYVGVLFIGGYVGWSIRRVRRVTSWPSADGTITHVEIVSRMSGGEESFHIVVRYTYAVRGTIYQGDRLAHTENGCLIRERCERIEHALKSGPIVDVHYDPDRPSESCLSYGIPTEILMSAVTVLAALSFLIGFTWNIWQPPHPDQGIANLFRWVNLPILIFVIGGFVVVFCGRFFGTDDPVLKNLRVRSTTDPS